MKNIYKFIISILAPLLVGAAGGYFTSSSVEGWYRTINKPSFNPPDWIFGPVWTTLYIMMGIALYLVWKSDASKEVKSKAIVFFVIQLVLNFFWTFIFFYSQQPGYAFIEIIFLWVMILLTIIYFFRISKVAGWLLVPYICWVSFASVLNYAIWTLN